MNIYIDSNIWLDLYHFSNNDLQEFSKLQSQEVNIILPEQTRMEVYRNRINKINDARNQFEKAMKFNPSIPNVYKEFENETSEFRRLISDFQSHFEKWRDRVTLSIKDNNLQADQVIEDLFNIANTIDTNEYYEGATKRMNIGNPPGKNNSYGDAINWIALLDKIPEGEDLYIITNDSDYYDDKDKRIINSFLLYEWNQQKNSHIYIFKSLVDFFGKHISIIKLREEEQKNKLIEELEQSGSFHTTHHVIAKLEHYTDSFSNEDIQRIVIAGSDNSQISSILEDTDVKAFYCNLLNLHILDPLDEKVLSAFQSGL